MDRNIKLALLSMLATVMVIFGILGFTKHNVKADTIEENFVMEYGAYVRLIENSTGLRFVAETNYVDEDATYNFVIAPTYYFEAVAGTTDYVQAFEDHEKINYFINLTNIMPQDFDDDGNYEIRGSIANIKFANINLEFTGIAYKQYANGSRVYAGFTDLNDISRDAPYLSSKLLNKGDYDDEGSVSQKAIMSGFIKKAFVNVAGYTETLEDGTVVYVKDETKLSLDGAYEAIAPEITISADSTQKLFHSQNISATVGRVNLDFKFSSNDANLVVTNDQVKAMNENGGTIIARAGILSAAKSISVDTVETLVATTDTIVDTSKANAITFGTGISVTPVTVYDVTVSTAELGYSGGKLVSAPEWGERRLAVLTADNTYYVNAVSSDCVIKTKEDLRYYLSKNGTSTNGVSCRDTAKYAILASNINGPGTSVGYGGNGMTNPYGSVFDGRNYTVSNVYCIDGWFGQGTQTNITFKNVNLENFIVYRTGAFGQNLSDCKIENVKMNVTPIANFFTTNAFDGSSLLCNWSSEGYPTKFIDCELRYIVPESRENTALWLAKSGWYILIDTNIVTNGKIALNGQTNSVGNNCTSRILDGSSNYTIIQGSNFAEYKSAVITTDNTGKTISATVFDNSAVSEMYIYDGSNYVTSTSFTSSGGNLTFTNSLFGEQYRVFKTANGWYKSKITIGDHAVSSMAEFKAWGANAGNYMYTVLINDISGNLSLGHGNAANSFEIQGMQSGAVFDGLNHKISNTYAAYGWFANQVDTTGVTIMNVEFENFMFHNYALVGRPKGLTLKNVKVSAIDTSENSALWSSSNTWAALVMLGNFASTLTLDNTQITFNLHKTDALVLTQNSGKISLTNGSSITTNCAIAKVGQQPWNTSIPAVASGTYTVDATSSITDKNGSI